MNSDIEQKLRIEVRTALLRLEYDAPVPITFRNDSVAQLLQIFPFFAESPMSSLHQEVNEITDEAIPTGRRQMHITASQ